MITIFFLTQLAKSTLVVPFSPFRTLITLFAKNQTTTRKINGYGIKRVPITTTSTTTITMAIISVAEGNVHNACIKFVNSCLIKSFWAKLREFENEHPTSASNYIPPHRLRFNTALAWIIKQKKWRKSKKLIRKKREKKKPHSNEVTTITTALLLRH